jgi:flavin reductase (DIM6/NTAB) family NADH-FMN oxidoreductase RutF
LLPNCAAYIHVKLLSLIEAGDHEVALCEVVGTGFWDDTRKEVLLLEESPPFALDHDTALYTGELRRDGIL